MKREGGRGDSSVASATPPLENIFTSYVESAEYSIIGNDETEGALVCDLARDKKELEPFDFNAAGFRGLYKVCTMQSLLFVISKRDNASTQWTREAIGILPKLSL